MNRRVLTRDAWPRIAYSASDYMYTISVWWPIVNQHFFTTARLFTRCGTSQRCPATNRAPFGHRSFSPYTENSVWFCGSRRPL